MQAKKATGPNISALFSSAAAIARSSDAKSLSESIESVPAEAKTPSNNKDSTVSANSNVTHDIPEQTSAESDSERLSERSPSTQRSEIRVNETRACGDNTPKSAATTSPIRKDEEIPLQNLDMENHNESVPTTQATEGKTSRAKKDRSKLRKGKWTVEEEEYASSIIRHFGKGVLTLPEGTTLRFYLAEKLNCDPMRITKKFAGTSCLTKRVYHLRDRSHVTLADVQLAKVEIARMEHRFLLRLERRQSAVSLPLPTETIPSLHSGTSDILLPQRQTSAAPTLLQSFVMAEAASASSTSSSLGRAHNALLTANAASSPWALSSAPSQRPSIASIPQQSASEQLAANLIHAPMQQLPQVTVASLALAQAAASLTPAISQLAAAHVQHNRQQLLEQALQAHLQRRSPPIPASSISTLVPPVPTSPKPSIASNGFLGTQISSQQRPSIIPLSLAASTVNLLKRSNSTQQVGLPSAPSARSVDSMDEAVALGMSTGFLSSLRKNFEDAVDKRKEENSFNLQGEGVPSAQPTASEGSTTTSHEETESSSSDNINIPQAGKKAYASSSEESDKEQVIGGRGSGPLRKRHKMKDGVGAFTSKNVAEHNVRMAERQVAEERRKLMSDAANG